MNIYFSGSIRGGRSDAGLYKELIRELKQYGKVLTEHVGASDMELNLTDREIHDRDIEWLEESDIVVAEVSTPSLGVGYEIARALSMNKSVHCLYRKADESNVSAMIKGSPNVSCHPYAAHSEALKILRNIFGDL
ncbi:MAG: nucleoside 2-deoxyribosyltransferase [Balneolaceae bacterium]|nr:nucleoside 2-deoxyribosyltransferase [Balneolaceae bacterium]